MSDLSALLAQLNSASKPKQQPAPGNAPQPGFPTLNLQLPTLNTQPNPQQQNPAQNPFAALNLNFNFPTPPQNKPPQGPPQLPGFANPPVPHQQAPQLPQFPAQPAPSPPLPEISKEQQPPPLGGFEIPDLSLSLDIAPIGLGLPAQEPKPEPAQVTEEKKIQVSFVEFSKRAPLQVSQTIKFDKSVNQSIQSVIDNAKNGTLIVIPEGEYNEELTIVKQVHLKGEGNVTITGLGMMETCMCSSLMVVLENINFIQIDTRGGGSLTVQQGYTKAVNCTFKSHTISSVQVLSNACCELENCKLVDSYNPCLMCVETSQAIATGCEMRGSSTFGVLANENSSITLEKCLVEKSKATGVQVASSANLLMRGCSVKNNQSCGVECISTGSIIIQDSNIEDHESGTGILAQGNVKVLCVDNTFKNNQLANIKAQGGAVVTSKQNKYLDAKQNVMILSHENATIDCDGDSFGGEAIAAAAAFDNGKLIIKNTKMQNINCSALLAYENGEAILENVEINQPASAAIQLRDNASFDFTNVVVNGGENVGCTILSGASGEIKNSKFINCSHAGIEIYNCGQLLIKDSQFSTNAVAGALFHDSCAAVIEGCEFANNGQIGVDITSVGGKPQFKKCVFSGSAEAIINITNGAEPSFVDSRIENGPKIGISVIEAKPVFHNCEITAIGMAGLSISGKAAPVFERCNIHDNNNFAVQIHQPETQAHFIDTSFLNHSRSVAIIALNGCFVDCTQCKFEGSLQPHCEIRDQATVQLTRCDVSNSTKGTGLQVHSGGMLQLNDTNIHNESKMGLMIGDKGTCIISGGSIAKCGQTGILAMGNSVLKINSCTLDGNGQFSMQILPGAKAEITGCTIQNHSMFGFVMSKDAVVDYSENNFTNNGQKEIYVN